MQRGFFVAALAAFGCSAPAPEQPPQPPQRADRLAPLRAFEAEMRREADFAALPTWDRTTGANPHAIAAAGDGRFVGLLRGRDQIALLDAALDAVHVLPAPASPTGLARDSDGTWLVTGEAAAAIGRYRVEGDRLVALDPIPIDALGITAIAAGSEGAIYVTEERRGRLLAVHGDTVETVGACHGPLGVERAGPWLVTNCLLDHALELRRVDGREVVARIEHDGPIWSVATAMRGDTLWIAAGGVEDRPLDRSDGSFGYIDSFAYLYRVDAGGAPSRVAAVNLSAHGVVTAKAIALDAGDDTTAIAVAGYGSPALATLTWTGAPAGPPAVEVVEAPPGIAAFVRDGDGIVAANPLLDAWVRIAPTPAVVALPDARPAEQRVGEALFFTTLMAPWNPADGRASRFTCETCHYEGYVDGRVHYTGRGEVHAATKPLLGLGNNRPHFSRALDRTMARMVHNEFRVANKASGRDPWFSLAARDYPWLSHLDGGVPQTLSPIYLRRSLMAFLYSFTHRPNPAIAGRDAFTALEREGAALFRDACETCHQARLIADEPASRLPFERWEPLVLSAAGPILWASNDYHQTGVEPYVHEHGARVPSLRRLYKKWPYFTNGTAHSIDHVLSTYGFSETQGWHANAPSDARRLTPEQQTALAAFLDLL